MWAEKSEKWSKKSSIPDQFGISASEHLRFVSRHLFHPIRYHWAIVTSDTRIAKEAECCEFCISSWNLSVGCDNHHSLSKIWKPWTLAPGPSVMLLPRYQQMSEGLRVSRFTSGLRSPHLWIRSTLEILDPCPRSLSSVSERTSHGTQHLASFRQNHHP